MGCRFDLGEILDFRDGRPPNFPAPAANGKPKSHQQSFHIFFPVLVIISAKAEVTHFAKAASLAKLSLAGRALGFVLQGAKRLT